MIGKNLKYLRQKYSFSQEELSEKIGVSRQTIAKWESEESLPDINKCIELATLFNASLDIIATCPLEEQPEDFVSHIADENYVFGIVKVGERGQVVIPKHARNLYGINSGDKLLVVGDKRGMAFAKMQGLSDKSFGGI